MAILETAKVARIARLLVKKVVPVSSYGYKFEKSQSYDGFANVLELLGKLGNLWLCGAPVSVAISA